MWFYTNRILSIWNQNEIKKSIKSVTFHIRIRQLYNWVCFFLKIFNMNSVLKVPFIEVNVEHYRLHSSQLSNSSSFFLNKSSTNWIIYTRIIRSMKMKFVFQRIKGKFDLKKTSSPSVWYPSSRRQTKKSFFFLLKVCETQIWKSINAIFFSLHKVLNPLWINWSRTFFNVKTVRIINVSEINSFIELISVFSRTNFLSDLKKKRRN